MGLRITYEQISEKRRIEHPASKGLSSMNVWRIFKKNNIGGNCKLNKGELMKEVFQCISEVNFDTVISMFEKIYPCILKIYKFFVLVSTSLH